MRKKFFISVLFASLSFVAMAQGPEKSQGSEGEEWFQRMRSEKIGFLTAEMDLTPEEAQIFWPVYNACQAEEFAAAKASREAFMALGKALSSRLGDKEIERLVSQYVDADAVRATVVKQYLPKFQKVLPAEKVAKLFMAEEKFRMSRINRLKDGRPEGPAGNDSKKNRRGGYPGNFGAPSDEKQMTE